MAHRMALGLAVAALALGCGGNAAGTEGERARIVGADTGGSGGTSGPNLPNPGTPGSAATGGGGVGGSYYPGGCGGSTSPGTCGGTTGFEGGGCGGPNRGPVCPATFPTKSDPCTLSPGDTCVFDVGCQSGSLQIALECSDGGWTVVPSACASLHDSCADTTLHCIETGWVLDDETCPDSAPEAGSECSLPGLSCGYPCDPIAKTGWSVGTCSNEGVWEVDGGCE